MYNKAYDCTLVVRWRTRARRSSAQTKSPSVSPLMLALVLARGVGRLLFRKPVEPVVLEPTATSPPADAIPPSRVASERAGGGVSALKPRSETSASFPAEDSSVSSGVASFASPLRSGFVATSIDSEL
ncbi:hypothetical protein BDV98DRAFT_576811 [Pterulicium gracile]|uniref:Uncharacterized protein n=1 Tax=Pterulicium gracile TaxID=1884261 RepID=A0A5C3Q752_9AGAR|nr:hypothetical protein BDV98DRAFT_576811 [Pterula gracilis]